MHDKQKELIATEFIKQFLTTNERFYKNRHTELIYLHDTLNRIFKKFLGWQNLDKSMLEAAFLANEFRFHEVQDSVHLLKGHEIPLTYVNVSVKEIVAIRSLLATLSEQANDDTRETYEQLRHRLQAFKEAQTLY